MTETEAEPRRRVVHPILFAAFPVLYLFAENVEDAELGDVVGSLLVCVAGSFSLLLLAKLRFQDLRRAGIAVSALLLLFFSYGYVATAIEGFPFGRHRYLLPLWGVLAALGFLWARHARRLEQTTRAMNMVAAILVLVNLGTIVLDRIGSTLGGGTVTRARLPDDPQLPPDARTPDIVYVIFDRYGGERALEEIYGYDNRPFLDELERRGLYVASESRGNYPKTLLSVASSLNADHLTHLTRDLEPDTRDRGPLRDLVKRHAVGRYLKDLGYRYVHLGSWWGTTARSPQADENITRSRLGEFATALYGTTVVQPVVRALSGFDFERREYERMRFQFDQLERLGRERDDHPRFVFAHILSPHGPYVVDRRGRFVDEETRRSRSERQNYLEQLAYVNARILRLLDVLQAGPESSHPVILLQSDEGPGEAPSTRRGFKPRALDRKFPILNTFYLPGIEDPGLYPTISPVNSFRKVFDLYFDAHLPLLPDTTYVYRSLDRLYDFVDVTDLVHASRTPTPEPPPGA